MQGKTINGFELIRPLGVGGMAEVWYAENEIQKPAAVKILNEDLAHNASIVDRFRNEAKVMVRLDYPYIRQVYGYGSIDDRPAIVMEYLDGADLKTRMKQGQRFTDEELRKWWDQIADALNYTHEQDVVHRDIKPSNIFVDKKGNIKLLDFGIAKVRESISMTLTGVMMGTLMYMSPEQVDDSKHIGPKSDIYSLAVTFVHLLTGKAPYDTTNSSDFKIRESIVYKPLDMTGVPDDWQAFLAPYLEKDPANRPELRHFEATSTSSGGFATRPTGNRQPPSDDEGTIVADKPQPKEKNQQPIAGASTPSTGSGTDASATKNGKPKSKKGLWIALAIAAVAAVMAMLLLKNPKTVLGSANGHEYVDLGLPSGTLWATCNVGANAPEEYGDYFVWGEPQPKSIYNWNTYQYCKGSSNTLTKYCTNSEYGNHGFTDNLTTLQEGDDPTAVAWGSGWHTPDKKQWDELLNNTTNKWTVQNNVKGRLFTAKNGRTLFLPAAGNCGDSESKNAGSYGHYWSRSLSSDYPYYAWYLYFNSNYCYMGGSSRSNGFSVRPVR